MFEPEAVICRVMCDLTAGLGGVEVKRYEIREGIPGVRRRTDRD